MQWKQPLKEYLLWATSLRRPTKNRRRSRRANQQVRSHRNQKRLLRNKTSRRKSKGPLWAKEITASGKKLKSQRRKSHLRSSGQPRLFTSRPLSSIAAFGRGFEVRGVATRVLLFLFLFSGVQNSLIAETWVQTYRNLLGRYLSDGGVDYGRWILSRNDINALVSVTETIASPGSSVGLEGQDLMAFRIDAYNAWMLRRVLENYPVGSVLNVAPDIFNSPNIIVSGIAMSLDHLEKKLLIREFQDERIHFAVNCASVGCPPLAREPFSDVADLDELLDSLTSRFLKSPIGVRLVSSKRQIEVSELFDWYQGDFGGIKELKRQISNVWNQNLTDWDVVFLPYDWSLNDIALGKSP